MNIILSSIGRRVKMVQFFKEELRTRGKVFSADCDHTAPGLYVADQGFILPKVTSVDYIRELITLCREFKIKAVIPFIDSELEILSKNSKLFKEFEIEVIVSKEEVIKISNNKLKTYRFFQKHSIPTVKTWSMEKLNSDFRDFPVIAKPVSGSASQGIIICNGPQDLAYVKNSQDEYFIQEKLTGVEVTIDLLADFQGNCLSLVPRKRIKVRGGEVERAVTWNNETIINWSKIICAKLKPKGPINVQCFIKDGYPIFFEINARFGGGYPLSYYAGANHPKLLIDLLDGKRVSPDFQNFEDNLIMMRYDEHILRNTTELI